MAISLVGSTITIDSGIASGTATGGSANTLTGTGFSTTWAGRIVWITSGTGAGQSRFIRAATATTLTVEPNWDVNPASGSVFSIGYTWADIDAALAGVTVSSPNFYLVPYNLTLSAGGFVGSLNEHVRFTVNAPILYTTAGSLWQQGRLFSSGVAAQGGSIEFGYTNSGGFIENQIYGRLRFYRTNLAALPGTGNYVLANANVYVAQELDYRDCYFNNIYIVLRAPDRVERCAFNTKPFWVKSATSPIISASTLIENSLIISGTDGSGTDSHYFDLTFQGIPQDSLFNKPFWVWITTTKEGTYFWNVATPAYASTFAASNFTQNPPAGAGFYTGKTVALQTRRVDGTAAASTVVGLWNASGNAAWFTGVTVADGTPINSMTVTTDASGNYANPHPAVAGQSGLVVAERIKQAGATQYGPWTIRARLYGFLEAGGARNYANRSSETLFMLVDPAITQTSAATVAAYTTLETSAKFYDYYQYFLSLAANIKTDNGLSRSGNLINAGNYNVIIDAAAASVFTLVGNTITIKASTFTGDMTTTGLITLANGATFIGTRTDANGTIAPPKTVSITGLAAGSRLRIYNVTTATEVVNTVVVGTSYSATYNEGTGYSVGNTVAVTVTWQSGASAKLPFSTQVVVGASGWSVLVSQQNDTVYNAIGVDGSTVTEFAPDYPNVQVDIFDPNGQTTIDRLYSWFVAITATADGIRYWVGGIVAEDVANFKVITSILNLKLDNVSASGVEFTGGKRLYRDDGATPLVASTTGGGSITLYADKVFVAETGVSGLTASESAKLMGLPSAGDTATATLAAAQTSPIHADIRKVNNITVDGVGTEADPFGPA